VTNDSGGGCRGSRAGNASSGIDAMPIYEYEACEGGCTICGGKLTLRRPLNAPPLTHCPLCRKPVRKLVSQVNTPKITKPVSYTDAKKAGFTVLKKVSKGEYERL
jgi:putative FmdB family regulatory protein